MKTAKGSLYIPQVILFLVNFYDPYALGVAVEKRGLLKVDMDSLDADTSIGMFMKIKDLHLSTIPFVLKCLFDRLTPVEEAVLAFQATKLQKSNIQRILAIGEKNLA